jgi:thymidylate kinase
MTTVASREFSVLLGPDYAGKSSVLGALAADGWQCVSYDREFVDPECSLVHDLRDGFVGRALRGFGTAYSADFLVTLLQTSVVYLRDQTLRAAPDRPVVTDSYYYKILAKCVLKGLLNEQLFAWWRSFPPPERVIYLDVDPETAWLRSGEGSLLNPFEYYGAAPSREGFCRFQTDLRRLMLREVGSVPMTVLSAPDGVGRTVDAIRRTITWRGHVAEPVG